MASQKMQCTARDSPCELLKPFSFCFASMIKRNVQGKNTQQHIRGGSAYLHRQRERGLSCRGGHDVLRATRVHAHIVQQPRGALVRAAGQAL